MSSESFPIHLVFGLLQMTCYFSCVYRVNGSLAVSRALGDYEYKNVEGKGQCEQLVSPEPEISGESNFNLI